MPHISKKLLQKERFLEIQKQFNKTVSDFSKYGETRLLLDTILTKTEKIMLSKRLAIIILLKQGESIYAVENILKVSPSTVAKVHLNYENGKYDDFLKEMKKNNSIWTEFKKIIPPKVGRDRFKYFLK